MTKPVVGMETSEEWNKVYFTNRTMRVFRDVKKYKVETWIHYCFEDGTEVQINPDNVNFIHIRGRKHVK